MIVILNMIKHEIIESIETLITGFGKVGGKKKITNGFHILF